MGLKFDDLPAASGLTADDLFAILNEPAGTSASQRLTGSQLLTFITHNDTSGIQGGTTDEYFHLTAAEYAGTWAHGLSATTGDFSGKVSIGSGGSGEEELEVHIGDAFGEILISSERNSASDTIGGYRFEGLDDAGTPNRVKYAGANAEIIDPSSGSEVGAYVVQVAPGDGGGLNDVAIFQGDGSIGVCAAIGLAVEASAVLTLPSTTKGFLSPVMTETQRDAISSPATGIEIYNTTTNVKDFYNGATWGAV